MGRLFRSILRAPTLTGDVVAALQERGWCGPGITVLDGGSLSTGGTVEGSHRENRILCALPSADRAHLLEATSNVTLDVRKVLFEPGRSEERRVGKECR